MKRLILGSKSPRRKEILGYFSLPFVQVSSNFNEDAIPFTGDPIGYVTEISEGKAKDLAEKYPEDLILTADTTVYRHGKIYGKPQNEQEAFEALSDLAGKWHSVFTSVTLHSKNTLVSKHEETRVLFNPLTPEEIRHYHKKLHWSDKAGGYAVQMAGGLAINKIEGCYYNVMGLPINTVRQLLLNAGIDLWDYIK